MVDGADDHACGGAIIDSDMQLQMLSLEGSKEKGPVDHVHMYICQC